MMSVLVLSAAYTRLMEEQRSTLLGRSLLAGTIQLGYYGEYTSEEVISGDSLTSMVGFSQGTGQNSDGGWLGFAHKGKRLLFAKKPFRHTVSWENQHSHGLIYGREVTVAGRQFLCRAPTGGNANPPTGPGGEWDELMYSISAVMGGQFASITDVDLGIVGFPTAASALGRCTWCQEGDDTQNLRVIRGNATNGISKYDYRTGSPVPVREYDGWRPVLELID